VVGEHRPARRAGQGPAERPPQNLLSTRYHLLESTRHDFPRHNGRPQYSPTDRAGDQRSAVIAWTIQPPMERARLSAREIGVVGLGSRAVQR